MGTGPERLCNKTQTLPAGSAGTWEPRPWGLNGIYLKRLLFSVCGVSCLWEGRKVGSQGPGKPSLAPETCPRGRGTSGPAFPWGWLKPLLKVPPRESSSPSQAPAPVRVQCCSPSPHCWSPVQPLQRSWVQSRAPPLLTLRRGGGHGSPCPPAAHAPGAAPRPPATTRVTLMDGISSLSNTNAFPRGDCGVFGERDH